MNIEEFVKLLEAIKASVEPPLTSNKSSNDNIGTDRFVGKWVICRSRNEGVNFGRVLHISHQMVVLADARRMHYFKSSSGAGEWYEQVSLDGKLASNSRLSAPASEKFICEDYSLTLCSDEAVKNIKEFQVYVS